MYKFTSFSISILVSFGKFAGIFALTQVPLAISEGLLTVLVWNWLSSYGSQELETLKLINQDNT